MRNYMESGFSMRVLVCTAMFFGAGAAVAADSPTSPTASAAVAGVPAGAVGESGLAAVYSDRLNGHRTASGKRYDRSKLTAAHRTLAFGTKIKVTNVKNGKSVVVVINDRGPKQANRILDLSPRAAHAIGIGKHSMGQVKIDSVN